jgi:hypothetical protein
MKVFRKKSVFTILGVLCLLVSKKCILWKNPMVQMCFKWVWEQTILLYKAMAEWTGDRDLTVQMHAGKHLRAAVSRRYY